MTGQALFALFWLALGPTAAASVRPGKPTAISSPLPLASPKVPQVPIVTLASILQPALAAPALGPALSPTPVPTLSPAVEMIPAMAQAKIAIAAIAIAAIPLQEPKASQAQAAQDGSGFDRLWDEVKLLFGRVPPSPAKPRYPADLVGSIGFDGDVYTVNGMPAESIGYGDFKEVLLHPKHPELVVKLFYAKRESSLPEKRREVDNIRLLEKWGAVPRLIAQGGVPLRGQAAGYLVQERVHGETIEKPGAAKMRQVRILFDTLVEAGLEMTDVISEFKLRQNIMVGTTASGGFKAYLVDPDVRPWKKKKELLRAYYDALYRQLAGGRPRR